MSLSCLHTHSVFCDGEDKIETLCAAALRKGLSSIGFSSHAPIEKKTGFHSLWHIPEDRLEGYLEEVRAARSRWEGRLKVYLGLEVDYIEGLMGPADRDYRDMGLDYIIGSVHYVVPPSGPPFAVDGPREEFLAGIRDGFGSSGEALMECYWDTVMAMISAGFFDILGHADIVKKNNRGDLFSENSGEWLDRGRRCAAAVSKAGIVTEVNTGGLNRGKVHETYPSPALLVFFAREKAPVLITADAHRAEDLDGNYGKAREILLDAGYAETVLFEGRKDGRALWKAEKLRDTPKAF